MGLRGPAAKPTAVKELEGNPGKRPLNEGEPVPPAGDPHCPDHLDDIARQEWNRIVPLLRAMRVLTQADYMTLAMLCQSYSTMAQAQKQMSETGLLYTTPSGYTQQSPLLSIVHTNAGIVAKLCREFGLTPASRSGIQTAVEPKQERDELAELARECLGTMTPAGIS
jgi:P27 family predicted phage terminase small subunit